MALWAAYITARLAPDRPMMHALALGVWCCCKHRRGSRDVEQVTGPGAERVPTPAHRAGTAGRIGRRKTSLDAIGPADRGLISCTGSEPDLGATELLPSDFVGYRILPLEIA
jgi:hypothetical protein